MARTKRGKKPAKKAPDNVIPLFAGAKAARAKSRAKKQKPDKEPTYFRYYDGTIFELTNDQVEAIEVFRASLSVMGFPLGSSMILAAIGELISMRKMCLDRVVLELSKMILFHKQLPYNEVFEQVPPKKSEEESDDAS